jgi:hypothetical protein
MPRRKSDNKLPPYRPPIPIDWNKVDKFLESGCPGTDIAGFLGCHPETFYARCKQEKGIGFTEYATQKRSSGDNLLRAAQMQAALQGNTSMLIWLGKNRLQQKDDPLQDVAFNGTLSVVMDDLKKMKKSTEK